MAAIAEAAGRTGRKDLAVIQLSEVRRTGIARLTATEANAFDGLEVPVDLPGGQIVRAFRLGAVLHVEAIQRLVVVA